VKLKSKIKTEKLTEIYIFLEKRYGAIECPLIHKNAYELFVAVVLSAQCTDKKVNDVTPELFSKYPSVNSLANAEQKDVENIIRTLGLFRTKSANIIAASKKIIKEFQGELPRDMHSLTSLPGVGRKTANVILGNAFNIPGFPVDTHVIRLMNRMGIVKTTTPEKIEKIVNANLDEQYWTEFSHLLITHGRACCKARKPDCGNCGLNCKI
jgi:endonuclease-3